MKKLASYLLIGSVLAMTVPAFAENRAVNIALGSTGGPLDNAALQTVRQVIGYAVARGTVDTFMVVSSGEIEGGILIILHCSMFPKLFKLLKWGHENASPGTRANPLLASIGA